MSAWNIHQKRAFYELCAVTEQIIHSGIDYRDIVSELAMEMAKSQERYIRSAKNMTAEVPEQ